MKKVPGTVTLAIALGVVLFACVVFNAVQRGASSPAQLRWLLVLSGGADLALTIRILSARARAHRTGAQFVLVWLIGAVMIAGLGERLPSAPTLTFLQTFDLRGSDPFTKATVQWASVWTALVVSCYVFVGERLRPLTAIIAWASGTFVTVLVLESLPEGEVPTLAWVPAAAAWLVVIFVGVVYAAADPRPYAPDRANGWQPDARQFGRGVWASLAVVLLGLGVADFESYVAIDQQVNADRRTIIQKSIDSIQRGLDGVDRAGTKLLITLDQDADVKGAMEDLEVAIADLGDQTVLAVEAQQLAGALPANSPQPTLIEQQQLALQRIQRSSDNLQSLLLPLGDLNPETDRDQLDQLMTHDLPRAEGGLRQEVILAGQLSAEDPAPTASVFSVIAVVYAALVLLPWALFVLFLFEKRDDRARECLVDLCLLDGRAPPSRNGKTQFTSIEPGSLLDRALGEKFVDSTVGDIQSALIARAFSEFEYLIGLGLLSAIVGVGWYMVFYPSGSTGIADIIVRGADAAHLSAYLLSGITPMTAAFVGAYFWCIYALVRRYEDSDLYPAAFLQCAVQFLLALVLSLIVAKSVPPIVDLAASSASLVGDSASAVGSHLHDALAGTTQVSVSGTAPPAVPAPTTAPPQEGVVDTVTILLAFVGGLSISAGFTQLLALLRVLLNALALPFEAPLGHQPRLVELDGIDSWTEARLAEEGLDNIQALATAPFHRLVLRTHFTTRRLVDWVDQALLYVHTADWQVADKSSHKTTPNPATDGLGGTNSTVEVKLDLYRALRLNGIRTATELLAASGWLQPPAILGPKDGPSRNAIPQQTFARKLAIVDARFGLAVETVCQALLESPHWVHIANYNDATFKLLNRGARVRFNGSAHDWTDDITAQIDEPARDPGPLEV